MTISLDLLDEDGTFIKALSGLVKGSRGWVHPKSGAGVGTLTIRNDHPDYDALYRGRIIRCNLDGSPVFGWILQDFSNGRLPQEGRHGKVTVWEGPGMPAYLGLGKWHAAVVAGNGNSGLMTLGWVTVEHGRSYFTDPFSFGQQQNPDSRLPVLVDSPPNWPDPQSELLWTRDLTVSGGRTFHPEGTCYFARDLRASGRTSGQNGPARVFISATNEWDCWWDGQHVASGNGHTDVQQFDVDLSATDDHTIGLRVNKKSNLQWSKSPGFINVTIIQLTGEGELGQVIYRTFTPAVYGSSGAADPWKVLDYTEPFGVTWGKVAVRCLDEAKNDPDRGAIPGVTTDAGFDLDSDNVAWSVSLPILSYRAGEQVGEVLLQANQQFGVDSQFGPDLVLHGYDDMGSDLSATVQLADATAAAAAADVTGSGDKSNVALVEVDGEFDWVGTPMGIRRETSVTMGLATSVDEVETAVEEALRERRGKERQVVTSAGPTGARPYTNFKVGDRIGVRSEDGGAYEAWEVASITPVDLPGGDVEFDLDLERQIADD